MLFMVFAHAMKAIKGSWLSVSVDILMAYVRDTVSLQCASGEQDQADSSPQ